MEAEESELPAPAEDGIGEMLGRFPFVDEWADLGGDEAPDGSPQLVVLGGEDGVTGHGCILVTLRSHLHRPTDFWCRRPTMPAVTRASIERRLLDLSDRIKQVTGELAVTDEQLAFLDEEAEDARLRAIVAETPLEVATANEAQRHADAQRRHRDALHQTLRELRSEQDALLDRLTAEPAPR